MGEGVAVPQWASAGDAGEAAWRQRIYELEGRLRADLLELARARYKGWDRKGTAEYLYSARAGNSEIEQQHLLVPWMLYHRRDKRGQTVLSQLVREHRSSLGPARRAWIEAQEHAWLSFWRICRVERGRGMQLEDPLTLQERWVTEQTGSATLPAGSHILARVVDFDGRSALIGIHPRTISHPELVGGIVKIARELYAGIDGRVPLETLRRHKDTLALVGAWRMAAGEHFAQAGLAGVQAGPTYWT